MCKSMENITRIFCLVILIVLPLALVGVKSASGKTNIKFASAPPGGTWYAEAYAISEVLNKKVPDVAVSVTTGGASSSPIAASIDKVQLGLTFGSTLYNAHTGLSPYKKAYSNLRVFASLIPSYIQWIVPHSSKIFKVEDFKGKVTAAGPKGLISEFIATDFFKIHGMERNKDVTIRNLGFQGCIEALKDGQVDAITLTPVMPFSVYINASKMLKIRFIKFDEAKVDEYIKKYPGFVKVVVPKERLIEIYGAEVIDDDLITTFTPQVICTHKDVPENEAYQMIKALAEGVQEIGVSWNPLVGFDPKNLFVDVGVPYHPGSVKYFKERGWVK